MNMQTPTVLHNNYPYNINIQNFCKLSLYARQSININGPFPIQINDGLDEGTFSLLANIMNNPNNDACEPEEVIPLLNAAIPFDIPLFLEKIEKTLCNFALIDLGIQCIRFLSFVNKILPKYENFIAYNFSAFVSNPHFKEVPCSVLYRIITWYNPTFTITEEILNFYFSVLKLQGSQATPIFLTLPYDTLPPQVLVNILEVPEIDFDVVGGVIMKHLHKAEEDRNQMQTVISQKFSINENCKSDLERTESDLDKTKERRRILKQRLADYTAKKESLMQELDEYEKKCHGITNNINEKKKIIREIVNEKEKSVSERREVVKETEETQSGIKVLEQQLNDRELERKAAKTARELAKKAEEERKAAARAAAEKARQEEEKRKQQKLEEQAKPVEEPPKNEELMRKYVEPKLFSINFNDGDFKKAFLSKRDLKVSIATPPSLKFALDSEGIHRAAELEFLWRNQSLGNARSCSDYGALIALSDPYGIDLASTLIFEAAEKNDPYAQYNAAVLIMTGQADGTSEEAADYIAQAAKQGEPNAVIIVKKLVHWEVPSN